MCCHQPVSAVKSQLSKLLAACEPPITRLSFGSFMVVLSPEILSEEMLLQEDPQRPFLVCSSSLSLSCPCLWHRIFPVCVCQVRAVNPWVLGGRNISLELSQNSG